MRKQSNRFGKTGGRKRLLRRDLSFAVRLQGCSREAWVARREALRLLVERLLQRLLVRLYVLRVQSPLMIVKSLIYTVKARSFLISNSNTRFLLEDLVNETSYNQVSLNEKVNLPSAKGINANITKPQFPAQ